ncbi:VWA domain-containing protein [Pseudoclavibacter chungangensis]|uniref:VWA domain-containing protein n=1 Tax=Pseudoclavibacter chungangensis TaxID=587635 RepID=A0A7J5BZJ3_9MICO|nr:vWA domain-containing protein [Pseudoclavibacter chungangensis]KAB1660075.1 VWA domain-containing protein [Pseudoclavibacter chungangensis]NYJ66824.1 hypothetical protein [Pseudoclavibacter chungangensis]
MTTRRSSRLLALVAAAALALGGAVLGAVAPANAAPVGAEPRSAMDDFGACLKGGGAADLLLLVDESSSLGSADPAAARVSSATYFINQLADSAGADGFSIDVQLGVFGDTAETIMGWTALDAANLPTIRDSIASLTNRMDGFDTDYWTALDSAQRELQAKAGAGDVGHGAKRCQGIVMFTDGQLSYSPRLTDQERQAYGTEKAFAPGIQLTTDQAAAQVRDKAQQDICREGGLADQLTSSKVKLFGIGLTTNAADPSQFNLFQSIVEGKGPDGSTCGSLVSDDRGQFFLASDIDSLLLAFDTITNPDGPPIEQEHGICQNVVCTEDAHTFVLDESTPDVRILAQADVANLEVSIQLPSGELVGFPTHPAGTETTVNAAGAEFAYTWETDKSISISATKAGAADTAWSGQWQLAFTDPAGTSGGQQSRSNIHIRGSLVPALVSPEDLQLAAGGTSGEITLGIANRSDDAPVDPTSVRGAITFDATVIDAQGKEFPLHATEDKAAITKPSRVDLTEAAIGAGTLRLTLGVTTADATLADGSTVPGTTLEPAVIALPVSIATPSSYPTIGESIDFGAASGDVQLTADLPISGEGCVWVDAASATTVVAVPEGIGAATITAPGHDSAGTCVDAAAGTPISLTLATEAAGNGTINGTVPVSISSADGLGTAIEVDVPFTANLEKPLNTLNFILVLIAAPLLGIGVPLLLLYAAKWAISRIPPQPLVGALVPVRIEHGQVLRDGAPFAIGPADLVNTVAMPPGGARRITVGDVHLRTRVGLSPTGTGYVTVDAPGRASAGSGQPSTDKTGVVARLPLAVHNTWAVLHVDGTPGDEAQLLLLVGGDATPSTREDLQNDVSRRAPDLLDKLLRERGAGGPGATGAEHAMASPFGGPSFGPGASQGPGAGGSPFGSGPSQGPGAGGSPFGSGPSQGPGPSGGGQPPQSGGSPWGTV